MSFRSGIVTIAGMPNAGKSTLLNCLAGEKVAIISSKPQTTRNAIRAVVTNENWQIVFIDTPGLHKPRTKLGSYMMNTVKGMLDGIDIVLYITETGHRFISEEEAKWLDSIKKGSAKSILVINKTDAHPKEQILSTIALYSEKLKSEAAVPISALKNDGIDVLMSEIVKLLPEGPKYYPDDTLTDQMEKVIAAELIREKALLLLEDEVPHGIGVTVEYFREREKTGILDITADIICDRESHKSIVIGKQGLMLKKIGSLAREDMERIFGNKIFLTLWVKVRVGWRNKQGVLKDLGYDK